MKKNKKIKPSPPDIGGIPATFVGASFSSTSDKTKYFIANSSKKELFQKRRQSVKETRGKK